MTPHVCLVVVATLLLLGGTTAFSVSSSRSTVACLVVAPNKGWGGIKANKADTRLWSSSPDSNNNDDISEAWRRLNVSMNANNQESLKALEKISNSFKELVAGDVYSDGLKKNGGAVTSTPPQQAFVPPAVSTPPPPASPTTTTTNTGSVASSSSAAFSVSSPKVSMTTSNAEDTTSIVESNNNISESLKQEHQRELQTVLAKHEQATTDLTKEKEALQMQLKDALAAAEAKASNDVQEQAEAELHALHGEHAVALGKVIMEKATLETELQEAQQLQTVTSSSMSYNDFDDVQLQHAEEMIILQQEAHQQALESLLQQKTSMEIQLRRQQQLDNEGASKQQAAQEEHYEAELQMLEEEHEEALEVMTQENKELHLQWKDAVLKLKEQEQTKDESMLQAEHAVVLQTLEGEHTKTLACMMQETKNLNAQLEQVTTEMELQSQDLQSLHQLRESHGDLEKQLEKSIATAADAGQLFEGQEEALQTKLETQHRTDVEALEQKHEQSLDLSRTEIKALQEKIDQVMENASKSEAAAVEQAALNDKNEQSLELSRTEIKALQEKINQANVDASKSKAAVVEQATLKEKNEQSLELSRTEIKALQEKIDQVMENSSKSEAAVVEQAALNEKKLQQKLDKTQAKVTAVDLALQEQDSILQTQHNSQVAKIEQKHKDVLEVATKDTEVVQEQLQRAMSAAENMSGGGNGREPPFAMVELQKELTQLRHDLSAEKVEMDSILVQLDLVQAENKDQSKALAKSQKQSERFLTELEQETHERQLAEDGAAVLSGKVQELEAQLKKSKGHLDTLKTKAKQATEKACEEAREEIMEKAEAQFQDAIRGMNTRMENEDNQLVAKLQKLEVALQKARKDAKRVESGHTREQKDWKQDMVKVKMDMAKVEAEAETVAQEYLAALEEQQSMMELLQLRRQEEKKTREALEESLATITNEKNQLSAEYEALQVVCQRTMVYLETLETTG